MGKGNWNTIEEGFYFLKMIFLVKRNEFEIDLLGGFIYNYELKDPINLGLFVIFCFSLSLILFLLAEALSSLLSKRNILEEDKGLPYECGFEPFGIGNNLIFGISYILIAILFLIFDIEIIFILPWVLCVSSFGFFQWVLMLFFFLILLLGFIFEWINGVLDIV